MVNYQQGKIYKIVCRITGEVYVGSTCMPTLAKRLAEHRISYNKNKKGFDVGRNRITSFQILERGNYYIDLLENFPCNTKDELLMKEREYYDAIECINRCRPMITDEEVKEYQKNYREDNKEHVKQLNKDWVEKNKDDLKRKWKEYRDNNVEKRKKLANEYYHKNIEKMRAYYRERNKQKRMNKTNSNDAVIPLET